MRAFEKYSTMDFAKIEEKHCRVCGGMKSFKYDGEEVPSKDWIGYGYAIDIGCICPKKEA